MAHARRLSFTLKTMFAGVTVFAIGLAWFGRQWSITRERVAVIHMIDNQRDWSWIGSNDDWEFANPIRRLLGDFACASTIGLPKDAFTQDQVSRIQAAFPESRVIVYESGSWTGPEIPDTERGDRWNSVVFVFAGYSPDGENPDPPGFDPRHSRAVK